MAKSEIAVKPYTVFLTIGPSNAGKSYYCKNYLIPQLQKLSPLPNRDKVNITYISSDEIRRELLGDPSMDKYHPAMLSSSKQAFDLLNKKLTCAMKYPVISEFIIVDTKGTNEGFREEIYSIARENRYGVVPIIFNYSDFGEYGAHGPIDSITKKDIKKTRESIFGLRRKPAVKNVILIKKNDFDQASEIVCPDHDALKNYYLPNNKEFTVISDIHGCYDEFIELLTLNGFTVEDHKITENKNNKTLVIGGDYIDKGPKIEDCIEFLYKNEDVIVIIGNHENRLYKELTQGLEHIDAPWFDSFDRLNDESKQKFIKVFERSIPFVANDWAIVTHAPCHDSMLCKIDKRSAEGQRYFAKSKDPDVTIYDELNQIHFFDSDLYPNLHIFGHIPTSTPGRIINGRMLIDGGCGAGGVLMSVSVNSSGRVFTKSVRSKQEKTEELAKYSKPADAKKKIDISTLDYKDRRRIWKMCENKVNFISGTMSPCDKLNGVLESIDSGIKFFLDHNVTDIVMQPKYMGSRCNMYLFKTNEESYCVSRNGYKIRDVHDNPDNTLDLYPLYDKMRERLENHPYVDWSEIRLIIIDGELMPWSALGEGLIQDFRYVGDNLKKESEFLKEYGFEDALNSLKDKLNNSDYLKDRSNLSKKDLVAKYGNALHNSFKAVSDFKGYVDADKISNMINIYWQQLTLYGSKGILDYKPFAILKIVYHSGEERILYTEKSNQWSNEIMFNILNEDGCHRYDLSNDEDVKECKKQFYKYTTDEHYEGVVLKPNSLLSSDKVPPYLKVRNPDYLTIIYGYDYLTEDKHKKLCEKKSISGKMKASISEWKKDLEMLKVNYNDISESNEDLKQLYAAFISDEVKDQGLDPRL